MNGNISNLDQALLLSVYDEVTKRIANQELKLDKTSAKTPFLFSTNGMVYGIQNEEVKLMVNTDANREAACSFYKNLRSVINQQEQQTLDERTVSANISDTRPIPKPRTSLRHKQKAATSRSETKPKTIISQAAMPPIAAAQSHTSSQPSKFHLEKGYFVGSDQYDDTSTINNATHPELFTLLTAKHTLDNIFKNPATSQGNKFMFEHNHVYTIYLKILNMLSDKRSNLNALAAEFNTASQDRKKEIAVKIGTECAILQKKSQDFMCSNKEIYYQITGSERTDPTKPIRFSGPLASIDKDAFQQSILNAKQHHEDVSKFLGKLQQTLQITNATNGGYSNQETQASFQKLSQMESGSARARINEKYAEAKENEKNVIDIFMDVMTQNKLVNIRTGDLLIPNEVYENNEDYEAFKHYALQLMNSYYKIEAYKGQAPHSQDDKTCRDIAETIVENICQLQAVINNNAKHP
ncbi:MAG: hypothetical protein PUP46_10450 [Endozoicomonas sp. (ex Botrylloides leachii)]|nr:hypothetical protein [Endozoicomonas sp. (ex Botrylloides leachii)]